MLLSTSQRLCTADIRSTPAGVNQHLTGRRHVGLHKAFRLASPTRSTSKKGLLQCQALFGGLLSRNRANPMAREDKKAELLEAIKPLNRGASASEQDKQRVEGLAQELEKLNPNRKALSSPLINGKWELLYTTSQSILGTSRPALLRPSGPIYQFIDADNLKAANKESAPFFNQVYADLTPMTESKVAVQFKVFKILGLIPVNAPDTARGELDTTYVDEQLRVSRGDKGNLFVLQQTDPSGRP